MRGGHENHVNIVSPLKLVREVELDEPVQEGWTFQP